MKNIREHSSIAFVTLAIALILGSAQIGIVKAAQDPKPSDAPAGNAENGKLLFAKDGCYECHGREGQGSNMSGPRIAPNPVPLEVLMGYVRKPTGEMPPYTAKVISDRELADIYAYLKSRPQAPKEKAAALLK
jgi:mono/diheme cytochrome c family protein